MCPGVHAWMPACMYKYLNVWMYTTHADMHVWMCPSLLLYEQGAEIMRREEKRSIWRHRGQQTSGYDHWSYLTACKSLRWRIIGIYPGGSHRIYPWRLNISKTRWIYLVEHAKYVQKNTPNISLKTRQVYPEGHAKYIQKDMPNISRRKCRIYPGRTCQICL